MQLNEGAHGDVVAAIIKHRRANPRIYPPDEITAFDHASVANELDAATCERLNNNDRWCESGEPKPVDVSGLELLTMTTPCTKCGCVTGWQVICKSCSGKRRVGWYCENCKTLLPR
jgi:hypothetical protein